MSRGPWALLDETRPDAAILDLNLGGQPATEVARRLSARHVPFVLVTGYGAAQSADAELRRAPRVSKPVNHRLLVGALIRLLDATAASEPDS